MRRNIELSVELGGAGGVIGLNCPLTCLPRWLAGEIRIGAATSQGNSIVLTVIKRSIHE